MKKHVITVLAALLVILAAFAAEKLLIDDGDRHIKVGFVYDGDIGTAYTGNFIEAQNAVEYTYGDSVETIAKYNVSEEQGAAAILELIDEGCDLIFTTSYGYGTAAKEYARAYPDIQFCQATCNNANEDPVLDNYHTFMGEIYEGRYISGVVAGMKLKELIEDGTITEDQAKAGYVAAYPYAEVISGYTAFFMGIQSVVPQATMSVVYTNTWCSYALEKEAAERLIDEGCVIISQHSDTTGTAVACENTDKSVVVYNVGYNQSMIDIAPTTTLIGCRINWNPYITAAVGAVLDDDDIEDHVDADIHGNDAGAGFEKGWVEMLETNEIAVADGTAEKVAELIEEFEDGDIEVFKGDFTGTDPYDASDTYDLRDGYEENADASAPSFHYVLDDVITVLE